MSRNRGPKHKLKKATSYAQPSFHEREALRQNLDHKEPMISAITGVAVLDMQLADLIRDRLRRKDEATWGALVSDIGPLQSFSQKIDMAYAMGFFDEKTRTNLHIIRRIRNVFAHPKRPITFGDPYILARLRSIEGKGGRAKSNYASIKKAKEEDAHYLFLMLCYMILTELLKKQTNVLRGRNRRRITKNQRLSAIAGLLSKPSPLPHQVGTGSRTGLAALLRTVGSSTPEPTKALDGLFGLGELAQRYKDGK